MMLWDKLRVAQYMQDVIEQHLDKSLTAENTSAYVQGVEVEPQWKGKLPDGFAGIPLPPCRMLVFQGPPFDDNAFEQAIEDLWDVMNAYRPETIGYRWADDDAPRFQLIPLGERGYIEGRPVRPM